MPSFPLIAVSILGLVLVFFVGWASIHTLIAPRFGVWLLFLYSWFVAIFVVWVGIILALAGWVFPKIFSSDGPGIPVGQKIMNAALAAVLLYVGKQLLELRHLNVAARLMKLLLSRSFTSRVSQTLPLKPDQDASRLAYRAVHEENFVIPNVASVQGWGLRASCRRVQLLKAHIN